MATKETFSILLVDQDAERRNQSSSRLRGSGYKVELGTGGFHTVHLAEKNEYHMVLLRDDMEDMSGLEIVNLIRTTFTKEKLPILVLSRLSNQDDIIETILNGANDLLVYTNNYNDLLKKIETFSGKLS